MPKSYSVDLRERVVRFVERGHSRRGAARHFEVSASFVINLMTHWRATGSLVPKRRGGKRPGFADVPLAGNGSKRSPPSGTGKPRLLLPACDVTA